MLCPSAGAVLPTIRSRSQIFTLRPPAVEDAARWLKEHRPEAGDRAEELARLCGGNLGRMLEELEGGRAGQAFAVAVEMAGAMLASGGHRLLAVSAELQKDRALFRETLERLSLIFRDACAVRMGGRELLSGAEPAVEKLCALPLGRLARLPGLAEECRDKLDRNANTGLLLAWFCAGLMNRAS